MQAGVVSPIMRLFYEIRANNGWKCIVNSTPTRIKFCSESIRQSTNAPRHVVASNILLSPSGKISGQELKIRRFLLHPSKIRIHNNPVMSYSTIRTINRTSGLEWKIVYEVCIQLQNAAGRLAVCQEHSQQQAGLCAPCNDLSSNSYFESYFGSKLLSYLFTRSNSRPRVSIFIYALTT
jgi:hypothetical protein